MERVTPATTPGPPVASNNLAEPTAARDTGLAGDASMTATIESFRVTCRDQEDSHLDRLRQWFGNPTEPCSEGQRGSARRRRRARRQARRDVQAKIRQEAAACAHALSARGYTQEESAALLGVPLRRLRHWDYLRRLEHLATLPVGRPAVPAPVQQRQQVLDFLQEQGPGVGVPRLGTAFPDLSRAALTDLVQRYRAVVRDRYATCARVLQWQRPGAVWAMDFAEPSLWGAAGVLPPIAGQWPYVLAVRDLASGYQLA